MRSAHGNSSETLVGVQMKDGGMFVEDTRECARERFSVLPPQIAARISLMDREIAGAGSVYSSREVFTRRTGDIADAVATAPVVSGDRLGQSYSRAPRPVMRRGEES